MVYIYQSRGWSGVRKAIRHGILLSLLMMLFVLLGTLLRKDDLGL